MSDLNVTESKQKPIIAFNNILINEKKLSGHTKNFRDEIFCMREFKKVLLEFSKKYGIDEDHFSIDTDGDALLIKEEQGEHYILPTHFEKGGYFSSPHFDHQLNYKAQQIPKIHIGEYTRIGKNVAINAGADIYIGNYVWLAPGSTLLRQEHNAYGQPSVGSRTIAMTNQPPIKVSDYAWVGRDAIVGWSCLYIGKSSIIGARSFVNKWVGDYSIVGDHSRILKYLPYKAYFFEYYSPSFREVLKISDWNRVKNEWLEFYHNHRHEYATNQYAYLSDSQEFQALVQSERAKLLVINPKSIDFIDYIPSNISIDVVITNPKMTAFILQYAQEKGLKKMRVQSPHRISDVNLVENKLSINGETGYDAIINGEGDPEIGRQLYRWSKRRALIL